MPRTLVTSALPYANGPIHLGHLAGAYLPADFYVRYLRLKGEDVVYVCGSDEMGVAIMMRAFREETTPQAVIDRFHPVIEQGLRAAGMSFDHYGRTSSPTHAETAREFFRTLAAKDVFKLRTEQQLFDPVAGVFLADRFVRGTCPVCGYAEAYGDQCENCGSSLSPSELVNPRSALSDAVPELRDTTHWYLPLGDIQPDLEKWLATHDDWKPNVLGQVKSWLQDGLRDRPMTRDLAWGIPVPEEVAEAQGVDATGKVLYVWFDAPIGYISATREWAEAQGDPDRWKDYWQNEETRLVHFIGKDNIVFHCLIFPGMLMLHGDYVLPASVPANEFLNLEGQKFSTSRGWAIWLHEFMERFDADLVRYALGTMLPETKDSDFSLKEFQARVNGELADVLGNFVNRTLTFAARQFEGEVPNFAVDEMFDLSSEQLKKWAWNVLEEQEGDVPTLQRATLVTLIDEATDKIGNLYKSFRFREALFETINLARWGNKHFNDAAPWHQIKIDKQQAANTIHVSLQLCASLSILLEPIVPNAAARLRKMLNLEGVRPSTPGGEGTLGWDDAARPLLPPGHKLGTPEVLFAKIEDDVIEAERQRLEQAAADKDAPADEAEKPFAPVADTIQYDDFARLDLRVGRVTLAERIPKADKLLRLEIDLGFETRQILAGIAQQYAPEDIQGRQVVIVANLAPRKLRGFESQGMVLMAEDREGRMVPLSPDAEPGSIVK